MFALSPPVSGNYADCIPATISLFQSLHFRKLLIEWFEHDQILFLKRMLDRQCVSVSDDNNVLLIGTFRQIP